MVKRKRVEEDSELEETSSTKHKRIQHKLKVGTAKLGHAFKVAKGFERQKLGRRRKNAASQDKQEDIPRIDAEIAALKTFDTTGFAEQHFYKILLKTKTVSEHPELPAEVKKTFSLTADTASLNVFARLCKSNQVRDTLQVAVDDVSRALGLSVHSSVHPKKKRRRSFDGPNSSEPKQSGREANEAALKKPQKHARLNGGQAVSDEVTQGESILPPNEGIAPIANAHRSTISALDGSVTEEAHEVPVAASNDYDMEGDLSSSESESDYQSASPEPSKASFTKKSSFIPSLTLSGYVSGSGSNLDDDIDRAPKRNRRGQRARQQIWEQKFGAKAKHLQRQDRNAGWDPKRGATDGNDRFGKGRYQPGSRASPDYNIGARPDIAGSKPNKAAKKQKHTDDGGAIHPSWEAAKKAKEKRAAPVAFQGKKISFD